jgi:hypothetical protein
VARRQAPERLDLLRSRVGDLEVVFLEGVALGGGVGGDEVRVLGVGERGAERPAEVVGGGVAGLGGDAAHERGDVVAGELGQGHGPVGVADASEQLLIAGRRLRPDRAPALALALFLEPSRQVLADGDGPAPADHLTAGVAIGQGGDESGAALDLGAAVDVLAQRLAVLVVGRVAALPAGVRAQRHSARAVRRPHLPRLRPWHHWGPPDTEI